MKVFMKKIAMSVISAAVLVLIGLGIMCCADILEQTIGINDWIITLITVVVIAMVYGMIDSEDSEENILRQEIDNLKLYLEESKARESIAQDLIAQQRRELYKLTKENADMLFERVNNRIGEMNDALTTTTSSMRKMVDELRSFYNIEGITVGVKERIETRDESV